MVDKGHRVVFAAEGSYIEDRKTFERMHLQEKNGMFFLKLWTKSPKTVLMAEHLGHGNHDELVSPRAIPKAWETRGSEFRRQQEKEMKKKKEGK